MRFLRWLAFWGQYPARPDSVTVPEVGVTIPAHILRRVDFPHPFSPMMARDSPASKEKLTESSTGCRPYLIETRSTSIAGPATSS